MTSSSSSSPSALSLPSLVPRLYPFFRHTIPAVRLAVPSALLLFLTVPSLPTSWIDARLFRFLLQNIVLEDRADIRDASLRTWKAAMNRVSESGDKDKVEKMWDEEVLPFVAEWMMIAMSPPGVALDANLFLKAHVSSVKVGKTGRSGESLAVSYNVDKNAMAQDLSLISVNVVLKGRFAAAEALALLMIYGSSTVRSSALSRSSLAIFHLTGCRSVLNFQNFQAFFVQQLFTYLASTAAHQILLASIIIEEWSKAVDESPASQAPAPLPLVNEHAKLLVNQLIVMLEGQTPPTYYEMLLVLSQAFTDCHALLATFVTDAKIPQTDLPSIPSSLDPAAVPADLFTVDVAGSIAGDTFEKLAAKLTRPAQKKLLPLLREKQMKIISSIGFYMSLKEKYDRQVSAALAAAVIALRTMPAKLNPVIRSIMNGVKVLYPYLSYSLQKYESTDLVLVRLSPTVRREPRPTDPLRSRRLVLHRLLIFPSRQNKPFRQDHQKPLHFRLPRRHPDSDLRQQLCHLRRHPIPSRAGEGDGGCQRCGWKGKGGAGS
jgi:TATA-binding protein-associated factor